MTSKPETASLEGGLTFGLTNGPYDGRQERREARKSGAGLDFFGDEIAPAQHSSRLSLEFQYPPFSVLNARDGWWQERKREWLALGIQSELGRGELAATGGSPEPRARSKMGLRSPMSPPKGYALPGGSQMPLDRMKDGKQKALVKGKPIEPPKPKLEGLAAIRQALGEAE